MTTKFYATPSIEDLAAIDHILTSIAELEKLPDDTLFTSPRTGECFTVRELHRVHGILDGFMGNASWDLSSEQ